MTSKTLLKKCRQEKRELLILADKLQQLQMSLLPRAIQLKEINVQSGGAYDRFRNRLINISEHRTSQVTGQINLCGDWRQS